MKEEVNKQQELENDIVELSKKTELEALTTQEDYLTATTFIKDIKTKAKDVEEFFKDMKANAYSTWKNICDKEKSILKPLSDAEDKLKKLMVAYTNEQDRIRRELEAKELAKQEKKIAKLEEKGKFEEAEALSNMSVEVASQEKVSGVSYRTDFEIVVVDQAKVPIKIAGTIIRPVDTAVIKQLAKVSKGKIEIPGIQIKEVKIANIRV